MTLTRKQQGFTIVELLIVIIVIGILATLVLVTFTGIQQSARNTERTTDIKAIASHLETYNAKNGRYPTVANMNSSGSAGDADFIATQLKGLDREALRDPKAAEGAFTFATAATATQYAYTTTPGTCDNVSEDCVGFSLSWRVEGSDEVKTVTNL